MKEKILMYEKIGEFFLKLIHSSEKWYYVQYITDNPKTSLFFPFENKKCAMNKFCELSIKIKNELKKNQEMTHGK